MKKYIIGAFVCLVALNALSQPYPYSMPAYVPSSGNLSERNHFQDMKFGMFIHWGIYSVLGDGEWVMHNEKIPYENYKRLADFFNPESFNAKEWVALIKNSGMKYITITSRHHDGFSMFNTHASKYNIVEATPYKKDPLMELAKECKLQGIELHFYYSLLDWGRTDYGFGKKIINGSPEGTDWLHYISFMKEQLTELITKYPAVKGIWFDGHWERPEVNWYYNEIYQLIHSLNPSILIGNNHHMTPLPGEDFQMFEKDLPGENTAGFNKNSQIGALPLETCETINNSWGFNINDRNYKSVKQIVRYLVNASARNANFLLNIGPMPNGKIQKEFLDTLKDVGEWLKLNGESIYGTRGKPNGVLEWGVITYKKDIMYCHIFNPTTSEIRLPDNGRKIIRATVLANNKILKIRSDKSVYVLDLNGMNVNDIDTIIKVEMQ